jgi:hypothetical protein
MKTTDVNKIIEEFESIGNISPSENWDFNFHNKLDSARMNKNSAVATFNIMMLILVFVNIGFIINTFRAQNTKTIEEKGFNYQTISDELLISSN